MSLDKLIHENSKLKGDCLENSQTESGMTEISTTPGSEGKFSNRTIPSTKGIATPEKTIKFQNESPQSVEKFIQQYKKSLKVSTLLLLNSLLCNKLESNWKIFKEERRKLFAKEKTILEETILNSENFPMCKICEYI